MVQKWKRDEPLGISASRQGFCSGECGVLPQTYVGEGELSNRMSTLQLKYQFKALFAYSGKAIGFRGGSLGKFGEHVHTSREGRWVCVKGFVFILGGIGALYYRFESTGSKYISIDNIWQSTGLLTGIGEEKVRRKSCSITLRTASGRNRGGPIRSRKII